MLLVIVTDIAVAEKNVGTTTFKLSSRDYPQYKKL
jgi:hypothetical protein